MYTVYSITVLLLEGSIPNVQSVLRSARWTFMDVSLELRTRTNALREDCSQELRLITIESVSCPSRKLYDRTRLVQWLITSFILTFLLASNSPLPGADAMVCEANVPSSVPVLVHRLHFFRCLYNRSETTVSLLTLLLFMPSLFKLLAAYSTTLTALPTPEQSLYTQEIGDSISLSSTSNRPSAIGPQT